MKIKKVIIIGVLALFPIGLFVFNEYNKQRNIENIEKEILSNPSAAGSSSDFLVLDGTWFKNGKNPTVKLPWLGEKVAIAYEEEVLGDLNNYGKPPNEALVKQLLSKFIGKKRLVLDIESWSILTQQKIDPKAEEHAKYYLQVMQWAHEVLPGTNVGYFGMPISPWFGLKYASEFMPEFQKASTLLMPVMSASDSLYPEAYVYYNEPDRIEYTLSTQLFMAKFLGKPVYPFMWHRGPGDNFNENLLPNEIIQMQCKLIRQFADGVVWWSKWSEAWAGGVWYPAAANCFK